MQTTELKLHNSGTKTLESLALIALVFVVFGAVSLKKVWLALAIAALVIGLFVPWLANRIVALWLGVGEILGKINNKLILGAVFFLFLVPLSLVYRLFGSNSIRLKRGDASKRETFWTSRTHSYQAADIENVW